MASKNPVAFHQTFDKWKLCPARISPLTSKIWLSECRKLKAVTKSVLPNHKRQILLQTPSVFRLPRHLRNILKCDCSTTEERKCTSATNKSTTDLKFHTVHHEAFWKCICMLSVICDWLPTTWFIYYRHKTSSKYPSENDITRGVTCT